jgi:hypothetical protein
LSGSLRPLARPFVALCTALGRTGNAAGRATPPDGQRRRTGNAAAPATPPHRQRRHTGNAARIGGAPPRLYFHLSVYFML